MTETMKLVQALEQGKTLRHKVFQVEVKAIQIPGRNRQLTATGTGAESMGKGFWFQYIFQQPQNWEIL